jgi:hypothetical protein
MLRSTVLRRNPSRCLDHLPAAEDIAVLELGVRHREPLVDLPDHLKVCGHVSPFSLDAVADVLRPPRIALRLDGEGKEVVLVPYERSEREETRFFSDVPLRRLPELAKVVFGHAQVGLLMFTASTRQEQERQREWEAALDRARARYVDGQRVEELARQATGWSEAERLRGYCDAWRRATGATRRRARGLRGPGRSESVQTERPAAIPRRLGPCRPVRRTP